LLAEGKSQVVVDALDLLRAFLEELDRRVLDVRSDLDLLAALNVSGKLGEQRVATAATRRGGGAAAGLVLLVIPAPSHHEQGGHCGGDNRCMPWEQSHRSILPSRLGSARRADDVRVTPPLPCHLERSRRRDPP